MNERLKERLPDVTGGKQKIFLKYFTFTFYLFFNYFIIGEPLYANVSKDTRLALLANAENAKSIWFLLSYLRLITLEICPQMSPNQIFFGREIKIFKKDLLCPLHLFFLNYKCVISATASNTSKPSKNSQEMQDIHTEKTQETRRNYSRKNIKVIVEKLPK